MQDLAEKDLLAHQDHDVGDQLLKELGHVRKLLGVCEVELAEEAILGVVVFVLLFHEKDEDAAEHVLHVLLEIFEVPVEEAVRVSEQDRALDAEEQAEQVGVELVA